MSEENDGVELLDSYYLQEITEVFIRYDQRFSDYSTIWILNELSKGKYCESLDDSIKYRLSQNIYRHIHSDIKNGYVNLDTPFKEVPYEIYPPVFELGDSLEKTLSKNEIRILSCYFFNLFNEIGGTSTSKDRGTLDNIIVYPNGDFMFLDCYPNAKYQDEVYGAALYVKKHRGK